MNATHLRFRDLWKSLWLFFAVFAKAGSRGELANPQGHWCHMACLLPSLLQPHHCESLTLNPQSFVLPSVEESTSHFPLLSSSQTPLGGPLRAHEKGRHCDYYTFGPHQTCGKRHSLPKVWEWGYFPNHSPFILFPQAGSYHLASSPRALLMSLIGWVGHGHFLPSSLSEGWRGLFLVLNTSTAVSNAI